jgi:hypothetical protein
MTDSEMVPFAPVITGTTFALNFRIIIIIIIIIIICGVVSGKRKQSRCIKSATRYAQLPQNHYAKIDYEI